jgi:parallel beta-helix repeat protein
MSCRTVGEERVAPAPLRILARYGAVLGVAASLVALATVSTVPAAAAAATAYVAPSGRSGAADTSCQTAAYAAIPQALASSATTVVVCPGVYRTALTITRPVVLSGQGATIQATGHGPAITVVASGATVENLTVTGATGEGILVVGSPGHPVEHVTVRGNLVEGNDRGNPTGGPIKSSPYRECNATKNVPGDCGEGIHLMTAADSLVVGNTVVGNAGGILLTDELGPTDHNRIEGNRVLNNVFDCGITIASHSPAGFAGGKLAPAKGGIYDNVIEHNLVSGNGTVGQGAGVLLASPLPGGAVYDNVIAFNTITGNGQSGITVHSHVPGQFLNGNVIAKNTITLNNLTGDMDFSPHVDKVTTAILVGTVSPLSITIKDNVLADDAAGVWEIGPVTVTGLATNTDVGIGEPVGH